MSFYQGLRNTTALHPVVFQGETVLVPTLLGNNNSKLHSDFNRGKSVGSFDIQVQLLTRISYFVGRMKYAFGSEPKFKCDLKRVPLISLMVASTMVVQVLLVVSKQKRPAYVMAGRINKCPFFCLFITASVLVGIVFLIFSIVGGRSVAKFHVVNASLTQFNLTATTNNINILSYNLTLDVELRNPSKTIGIRYRRIRVAAKYKSKRFAFITFPPFHQGHKNTTILHPVLFQGEAVLKLGESELKGFNKDHGLGSFGIRIEFYLDLTLKLGALKLRQVPTMLCDVKLPLGSYNGSTTPAGGFKIKKCSLKQHLKYSA